MTYYTIGNVTFPAIWLATVLAMIGTALLNRIFSRRSTDDWYWNAFLIYLSVWKLSYIIFQYNMFYHTPFSILYFNGGVKGHVLALASVTLYLMKVFKKDTTSIGTDSVRLFLLFFFTYHLLISYMESELSEMNTYIIMLSVFLSIVAIMRKKIVPETQILIFFIFLELLLRSIFQSIFSMETMTFLWIGLTVFILQQLTRRNKGFE
ncbi:hypothetical protein JOC95_003969 [Bacillus tianshenii]|uniref:Uncharacterized protein n=1 Tax=Sutcliffiella tianshenii TaxID=1463404 RepID=A0ABS2P5A9_9BACI|nr:hypothetical protein [Bacillus tianshenii]MBM7622059.1 hypothetical protein [Bacillus tianshenii]